MNKALHLIRLFALNRLPEAQQIANRGLPLITTPPARISTSAQTIGSKKANSIGFLFVSSALMLLAPTASATDYYWLSNDSPLLGEFSNPVDACTAHYNNTSANWIRMGYANSGKVEFASDTLSYCLISVNGQTNLTTIGNFGYARRRGNSCPTGVANVQYNPTTGACANDEQKGPPPPNSCALNPINIAIGNKYQAETDYPSSGASTLSFTRTYNSLDGLWRHNHSTYLRFALDKVALVMAHGRESFFTVSGSTITAAPTELGQLVKTTDGWLYTAENNERFTFDAAGRLTRRTNATGEEQQLTYANGKVTVTDHLGQSLSFSEDAQHQPLTLNTPSLQITYSYNANQRLTQLTRTRDGQSEQRQFHYEDPRNPNLLTGITDERGIRYASWTYDDQGRAISSEHAGGVEHGTVAYNADGSSSVTNELGKTTVYRFVSIGGIKRVSAVEGEASANCPNSNSTFTYDSRGLLKTKTDNKGHLTTYDYNARGLEISRTEAAGTSQARTITTEWHPTLFLPVTVTEPNRITSYSYDEQGRQLSQTLTNR